MKSSSAAAYTPVPLGAIISTKELLLRPRREPNFEALSGALTRLAKSLVTSPEGILQELVENALDLCSAQSAGISLLEEENGQEIFRCHGVAGRLLPYLWSTVPRESCPWGIALDADSVLLISRPDFNFTNLASIQPTIEEALFVPFHVGGVAVGTIWVAAHDRIRQFDAEDARVATALGDFASAAYHFLAQSSLLESIFATARDPLLVLDDKFRVLKASLSFYGAFQGTPEATEGRCLYQLCNGAWDLPELRMLLEDVLPNESVFKNVEVKAMLPLLGLRTLLVDAHTLRRERNSAKLILLGIQDVTDQKFRSDDQLLSPLSSLHDKHLDRAGQQSIHDYIAPPPGFEEFIGNSTGMARVLKQVKVVAPTDATVLILGETGTGKELVARAVHKLSPRKKGAFITLNCAAIPTGLLESELFGYEKGAFTGALQQKIGRFEMANHGTLFLDEVGDIPLELQPKLLRALQEKAFERLGATRTIPINVRLVAATNRDLRQMMRDHLFRSDLFYRLFVFPIVTPPLRKRPEDIATLARHFTRKFARDLGRAIDFIPAATMKALISWSWPGNVRELENFIERSVILSQGSSLRAPISELQLDAAQPNGDSSLNQMERDHIVRIFRESGGAMSVAAKRLGIPRTSLSTKMIKLGISRDDL
jgi:transcriptional regulator with PAS, ATPase and Fis domain